MLQKRRDFLLNAAYFAVWAALVAGVAYILLRWALPVVLAAVTAVALHRPQRWLTEKTHISRRFFSVLLVCTLVAAAGAVIAALGAGAVAAATRLLEEGSISQLLTDAEALLHSLAERLAARLPPETGAALQQAAEGLVASLGQALTDAAAALTAATVSLTASGLPRMLLAFFVWFLASVLILIDYDGLRAAALAPFSPQTRTRIEAGVRLCGRTAGRYAGAYGLLMLLTALLLSIGFLILGIPHAWGLAALVAVIDILPVLGVGTVLLPAAAVSLLSGDTRIGLGLLVLYAVVTAVRNLTEPRLISRRTGIHPLLTLLLMYAGFRLIGVAGLLLLPFLGAVAVQLYKEGIFRL